MRNASLGAVVVVGLLLVPISACKGSEPSEVQLPTSAQVTTDIAGKAASSVRQGVLRVICKATNMGGTGFLHRSGNVLTAAHVVKGCSAQDVALVTISGQVFAISSIDADDVVDLALLKPIGTIPGQALSIAPVSPPEIGMQVATWGYPGGYSGLAPLLSVGYLAGTQEFKDGSNPAVLRWVVNAAFNGGNSGGPVLSLENGSIIGVVDSKLTPVPQEIAQILEVLQKQQYGLQYNGTKADGTAVTYSEGQLIGEVLQYLRGQVQLVIGYSIAPDDIAKFLKARKLNP